LKTRKYETVLIARPEFEKEQIQELVKRLSERIERNQGKLMEVVDWGLRKLAYPIRLRGEKFFYGRYVALVYAGNGKVVKELEDYMKLIDDTYRFSSFVASEEVTPMEQPEPIWREEIVPEIKLRDDGEGLEVIEPSRLRKLSKDEMYRPRQMERVEEAAAVAAGAEAPAAEGSAPAPAPDAAAPAETAAPAPTEPVPAPEKESQEVPNENPRPKEE
jgi:small subunit ribosomal protein S6